MTLLSPLFLPRYRENHRISSSPWIANTHLNKLWDVLGCSFPFPLLDGGPVGGCGSLADLCTNAGALLLLCFDSPADVVPGIISMLELSLDELSVCCSRVKINLMFSPIECSSEDTCRDSWSILAFISSTGRPGPLWKSPEIRNEQSVQSEFWILFEINYMNQCITLGTIDW